MKRLNYQNYLMVKDITGSVKTVELLPDYTNNLDDPNWLYVTRMGTNETERLVKTTISHLLPTVITWRMNTIGSTRINFLVYNDRKELTIRFCFDCKDKDIMDEVISVIINVLKEEE